MSTTGSNNANLRSIAFQVAFWTIYWAIFRSLFMAIPFLLMAIPDVSLVVLGWVIYTPHNIEPVVAWAKETFLVWAIEGAIFGLTGSLYILLPRIIGFSSRIFLKITSWEIFGLIFGIIIALIDLQRELYFLGDYQNKQLLLSYITSLAVTDSILFLILFAVNCFGWLIFARIGFVVSKVAFRKLSAFRQMRLFRVFTALAMITILIMGVSRFGSNVQLIHTQTLPSKSSYQCIAISPDGKTLATAGYRTINLWNLQTGKMLRTFTDAIYNCSLTISPDGKILASISYPNPTFDKKGWNNKDIIKLWNLQTGELLRNTSAVGYDSIIAFSSDGKSIISSSPEGIVELWNIQTNKRIQKKFNGDLKFPDSRFDPDSLPPLAISAKAQLIATPNYQGVEKRYNGGVAVWNWQTGKLIRTFDRLLRGNHYSFALSPDGKILANSTEYRFIELWSVETGKLLQTLPATSICVFDTVCGFYNFENIIIGEVRTPVTFSPDGQTLISSGYSVKVWRLSFD